jgi:hypothetical protein
VRHPVSTQVNSPRHDGPHLLDTVPLPAPPPSQATLI